MCRVIPGQPRGISRVLTGDHEEGGRIPVTRGRRTVPGFADSRSWRGDKQASPSAVSEASLPLGRGPGQTRLERPSSTTVG